jgi:hypothetical protein
MPETEGEFQEVADVSGTNKYQVTGGTGKMKGIKGSGTCTLKGNADSSVDYDCTGTHTMPAAAAKK